jgi:hypothetical protein
MTKMEAENLLRIAEYGDHQPSHNFRSPEEITRESSGRLSRPPVLSVS